MFSFGVSYVRSLAGKYVPTIFATYEIRLSVVELLVGIQRFLAFVFPAAYVAG